jgi:glycerol kinase
VPIAGVAGDQQAAMVGQLCTVPGMSKNTYGTGCFLLMNTGETPQVSENKLVTTVAWRREGEPAVYALEGGVFIGGAAVQWLRDGLKIIGSAPECDRMAESVPDAGGCVLVPAFAGLGAPHWDQYARGALVGITRGTTAAHLCRATLEGIAFSVADLAEAMSADAGRPMPELRVDGGAANSDILLQIQADLLRAPVVRPRNTETTAAGAAYLAGLATGVFESFEQLAGLWEEGRRFEPLISEGDARWMLERWRDAVERAKGWEPVEPSGS